MAVAFLVLASLGGDTLALKEKAGVSGRWVRLADLLDADRSDAAARAQVSEVYLGRAPEEGRTRTITADEIRKELDRRGLDPLAFEFRGDKVEVSFREDAAPESLLRTEIAFEIKRHLLDREPGLRPDEVAVRITHLYPDACPEGFEVKEIRSRGAGYTAILTNGEKKLELSVAARVLKSRDVAYAAREIPPGKVLDRADLEVRRVETSGEETYAGDLAALLGGASHVRIRKGAAIVSADVRLKPVVRRGDLVRAISSGFEVDARALSEGAPGQEITLEFVSSKNRLRGKVVGASRVEVVEGGKQ